jgi:multiple sugar transport system permease protein
LVGNAYFIWKIAFSGDSYGYINSLLLSIGITTEPIVWLKDPEYLFTIVIIVQLWQSMGVSFLSNISGLQNVNRDLYEAGAIDGIRNRWQELRYITLPSMSHMLLFSAVMQIQSSFSVSAIAITLAGYPSKSNAVDTIVSLMQDMATVRYELGYASAIAVVLFIMMVTTRLLVGKILSTVQK